MLLLTVPLFQFLRLRPVPFAGKEFTMYGIEVCVEGAVWRVWRRYSEFRTLHATLSEKPHNVKVCIRALW